jgi:hypothetical protein
LFRQRAQTRGQTRAIKILRRIEERKRHRAFLLSAVYQACAERL